MLCNFFTRYSSILIVELPKAIDFIYNSEKYLLEKIDGDENDR